MSLSRIEQHPSKKLRKSHSHSHRSLTYSRKKHTSGHYPNEYQRREDSISSNSPNNEHSLSHHSHAASFHSHTHNRSHPSRLITIEQSPYFRPNHKMMSQMSHPPPMNITNEQKLEQNHLLTRVETIENKMVHLKKTLKKAESNYSKKICQLNQALEKLKIQNIGFENDLAQYNMQLRWFESFVSSLNLQTPKSSRTRSHSHSHSHNTNIDDYNNTYTHPNLLPHNSNNNNIYTNDNNNNNNNNNNNGILIKSPTYTQQSQKTISQYSLNNNNNENINISNINYQNNNNYCRQSFQLFNENSNSFDNNSKNKRQTIINTINEMDNYQQSTNSIKSNTIPPGTTHNINNNNNNNNDKNKKKFELKVNTTLNKPLMYNYNNNNTPTSTASRLSHSISPKSKAMSLKLYKKYITFDEKPFDFQISVNEKESKITVKKVSRGGNGYHKGVKRGWGIIQVNNAISLNKMMSELKRERGPFTICFQTTFI